MFYFFMELKFAVVIQWVVDVIYEIQSPYHCVKSFQTRSFSWSVFSRIRTEYGEIRSMCFEGLEGVISQESHAYWRQVWNKFLKF